jgi:hypothetical protein
MIERLYPGVYLTELPCDPRPIEGVSPPPDWTQLNPTDPGVTLVQLLAFVSETLLWRDKLVPELRARPHWGVAQGLAVADPNASEAPNVEVSAGLALDARGLTVDLDASLAARRLPQPDSQTHRVDLSRLVSRYIGETEKNLGAVFNDAPPGRALLEYDESASLFGKR